jgi:hypothetical protein
MHVHAVAPKESCDREVIYCSGDLTEKPGTVKPSFFASRYRVCILDLPVLAQGAIRNGDRIIILGVQRHYR